MACWGAAYVPSAWLVDAWPPLSAAGARLGLAGLGLLGALTQTALFYGAVFWGIDRAGAGLSAVLANTDPLFVAVLAAVFLGERLAGAQWAGLSLGLAGAALVAWEGPLWPPALSTDALVVVGGALAWSVGTVVAARSVRARADPLALAAWQMSAGGVALALAGLVGEGGPPGAGARELALVVGLAALGSAAPLALFYLALARAPAAEVSAWFFLVPAVGVASAWPLLGEVPSGRLLIGLAAVCGGLWLVMGARVRPDGRLVDSSVPP